MAKISGFNALRYDPKRVSLKKVVCPPYDVINRSQRRDYIKNSANNVVKLVLPERKDGGRDYRKAKNDLTSWIRKGILKEDHTPSFYIYIQEYKLDKRKIRRCGFLSALSLSSHSARSVLPHEKIFTKPFMDRVNLMKETRAHLSPIFMVCKDRRGDIARLISNVIKDIRPDSDFSFEGVRHKLWRISSPEFIKDLSKKIAGSKAFIADGHHRFAASVKVKEYFESAKNRGRRADGYDRTLVYMVSSKDKGLMILPTYRAVRVLPLAFSEDYMIKRLSGYFNFSRIPEKKVQYLLRRAQAKRVCAFAIYYDDRYFYIELKDRKAVKDIGPKDASLTWKNLDVSILHNLVFSKLLNIKENVRSHRNIYYYKGAHEMISRVKSGEQRLGVFLNAPTMSEVERIAEAGEKMPHKSTYFFPKPLTGLVIHKF